MINTNDVLRLVQICNQENLELPQFLREQGLPKTEFLQAAAVAVFEGALRKADIFYALGSFANELEGITPANLQYGQGVVNAPLGKSSATALSIFDPADVQLFQACRYCITEIQTMVGLVEKHIWAGTFTTLRQELGPRWLVDIDKNKRKAWAAIREEYRADDAEVPLHEFSALPDLKDIILGSRHWALFSKHLPKALAQKSVISDLLTTSLIPLRNRLAHPTRQLAIRYSEYRSLDDALRQLDIANWRDLDRSILDGFPIELPRLYAY
jgi:hypothetical protein